MKEIRDNENQIWGWIVGISVAIFLLLIFFSWLQPRIYNYSFSDGFISIYPKKNENVKMSTKNVSLTENGDYNPYDGDPQLIFDFSEPILIHSIGLFFRKPLEDKTEVQIYYASEGQNYSEERVIKIWIEQNAMDYLLDLPTGSVEHLRVDINGECCIETIKVSPNYTQKSFNMLFPLLVLVGLAILIIAFFLAIFIIQDSKIKISNVGKTRSLLHIEIMRTIAAFFVIFNHTGEWGYTLFLSYEKTTLIYWYYLLVSAVCKVSVPLFFMISGALLLNKEEESTKKILKRIFRIFIILFVFSFISYIQQIHFGNEVFDIGRFFGVFISDNWMSPYWYLYTYIGFLISIPLLRKVSKAMQNKDYRYMIILVVAITGFVPVFMYLFSKGKLYLNSDLNISWMSSQIFFYPLVGNYLENRMKIEKVKKNRIFLMWVFNAFSLIITCYVTTVNNSLMGGFPQTFMMSLVPINAICIYITTKKIVSKFKPGKRMTYILTEIGACTFGIYLFHGLFLREQSLSLYLKIEQLFNFAPLLRELLRCFEAMIICGLITWLIKKIPWLKKFI